MKLVGARNEYSDNRVEQRWEQPEVVVVVAIAVIVLYLTIQLIYECTFAYLHLNNHKQDVWGLSCFALEMVMVVKPEHIQ